MLALFNFDQGTDYTRDEEGRSIVSDTDRNWQQWISVIDMEINGEINDNPKLDPAVRNANWLIRFRNIERSQENAPRYINYIINRRRQAGLPEIVGYEPAE